MDRHTNLYREGGPQRHPDPHLLPGHFLAGLTDYHLQAGWRYQSTLPPSCFQTDLLPSPLTLACIPLESRLNSPGFQAHF